MCVVLRLSALTLSSQNRKPDSSLGPHVPKAWDEAALADWATRWRGWMCGPVTSRKRSTTLYWSRTCASTRCITRAGSLKARRLYVQLSVIGMARRQLFRKRSWASRLILLGIRGGESAKSGNLYATHATCEVSQFWLQPIDSVGGPGGVRTL